MKPLYADLDAALKQIEAAFPVKKSVTIYDAAKRYTTRTRDDDLEADHIRIESHPSKYI